MNLVILTGRLAQDPDIRMSRDGQTMIATYTLAVDTGKDTEADYYDCKCFNKSAQFVEKYLRKGTKIAVTGSLSTERWNDKESGRPRRAIKINVRQHEFCEAKKQESTWQEPQEELPFN